MARKTQKDRALAVHRLFDNARSAHRVQWEYINQKGFDFAHDNQITDEERKNLEDQGMPTFTINRIIPIVEMLNFYATAQNPRWQAIAVEGSDSNVASVFSDMADYIWYNSNGSTLYANAINDSITKSMGYLMVTVNPDADNGLGEVVVQQPDPFDIFVDEKSRDILFRDASYIMIRKVIPKNHLVKLFPNKKAAIKKASELDTSFKGYTEKSVGGQQKDFHYKDFQTNSYTADGEQDEVAEFFEVYEKVKVEYMNVFYQLPPNKELIEEMQQTIEIQIKELERELTVRAKENFIAIEQQLQSGQMIPERAKLEQKRIKDEMQSQLEVAREELTSEMSAKLTNVENKTISEKEFKILMEDENFRINVVDAIPFYTTRIKQTFVVGDVILKETFLPDKIDEYPIVPIHFKWTGTPYPISAVAPLIGKQREINKSHQIMVHNASLGSSLRWVHEEGAIDLDLWQRYSSAPGALLPIRPGAAPPQPVQPAPLSNAFFTIVQEGKQDMEYLAGIYSSMQGDTKAQHETYRGLMALDEYGTRRVKGWLKNSVEPALKQIGLLVAKFSQSIYTANKKFRIVQPNALQETKEVEINIPLYNDVGRAVGKSMDWSEAKFDVRIIAGSTLPVNRWAYLAELKELMQLGVVDDLAVLAETDLKNKDKIAERKSAYAQMQSQLSQQAEQMKSMEGTITSLQSQLVRAGIKGKVQDAEMEINKKKEQVKSSIDQQYGRTEVKQKALQSQMAANATLEQGALANAVDVAETKLNMAVDQQIKDLDNTEDET